MQTFGMLFNRQNFIKATGMLLVILALSVAPIVMAAAGIDDDEFNGSSLSSNWSVTHTEGGATIGVSGGALQINVPSGDFYTFSNTNQRAPRILQPISDDDFIVEVKFNSSMIPYQDDKIQGILVRDETNNRWLRFDFNTDSNSLNTYVGHLQNSTLTHIENVSTIDTQVRDVPLFMRVQYDKSSGAWSLAYRIGDTGDFLLKKAFTESEYGFSFIPSHIGLFAGSTGDEKPGFLMQVDYFRSLDSAPPPVELDELLFLPIIVR